MTTEKTALSCFVLMPSGVGKEYHYNIDHADHVFSEVIQPAIRDAEKQLERQIHFSREVDSTLPGAITRAIVRKIADSDIVIADITGRNPNVFLELGIRYTLAKRVTILLNEMNDQNAVRSESDVPFDIQNMRYIRYRPLSKTAWQLISSTIVGAVRAPRDHSDSLVYEFIPNLEVSMAEKDSGTMPWGHIGIGLWI